MIRRLLFVALAAALLAPAARADVKLHPLFSDGMVLQRDANCPVWGTADPGEKIRVILKGGATIDIDNKVADEDGRWKVELPLAQVHPAADEKGAYTLTVKGKNTVTIKDVYLGEVWVASGQSNMEMAVNSVANAADAKKNAKNPKIRLFTVKRTVADKPQSTVPVDNYNGKWLECNSDTVGGFSAVAYFFGKHLQAKLDVPIGLIHTSWGGTLAEAWTPQEALEANASLKHLIPAEIKLPPPKQEGNPNQGTCLYNGMIHPLLPFAVKGAIWYQGESNAGRAIEYRTLFPTMIESWRKAWNNPDMPFLFVQLAPWLNPSAQPQDSGWAELREAQLHTFRTVKKTGMAVITDVGDAADIHPKQKEPVGARLALAARALAYGENVEFSGPIFQGMDVEGDKAVLHFKHVGKGLEAKYGAPLGFTVAGEDKKFYNANAEVKGDTVVVWCDKVPKPVTVRFGWANCPVVDLWNKDGLPASPFRSDDVPQK